MSEAKYHYEQGAIHKDNHRELSITLNGNVNGETLAKLTKGFFEDSKEDAVDVEEVPVEEAPVSIWNSCLDARKIETDLRHFLESGNRITAATQWYVVLSVFKEKAWTQSTQKIFVQWVNKVYPDIYPPKNEQTLKYCKRADLAGVEKSDSYPRGPYKTLAEGLKKMFFGELLANGNYREEEKYLLYHQNPREKR